MRWVMNWLLAVKPSWSLQNMDTMSHPSSSQMLAEDVERGHEA